MHFPSLLQSFKPFVGYSDSTHRAIKTLPWRRQWGCNLGGLNLPQHSFLFAHKNSYLIILISLNDYCAQFVPKGNMTERRNCKCQSPSITSSSRKLTENSKSYYSYVERVARPSIINRERQHKFGFVNIKSLIKGLNKFIFLLSIA